MLSKNKSLFLIISVFLLLFITLAAVVFANATEEEKDYKSFYEATNGVTVTYKTSSTLPFSDLGSGLDVVMKDYTSITFNKTIDLNDEEVKESFLEFYVLPSVNGTADFQEMFVYLYDINNEENFVKIRLKDSTTVVYTQAGANNNSLKGKGHWDNRIYTDGIYGGAEEASFSGYYQSGTRRTIKLQFDNETMIYKMNNRFIVDLDDIEFYTYSQHFKGFSSGQVKVKIAINSAAKQRAEFVIIKLGNLTGSALNITEIVDTEGPVITVSTNSYGVEDFVIPVVGNYYPLYNYSALDSEYGFCPVSVEVLKNGSENVSIVDNKFYVDSVGEYKITYSAVDGLNNMSKLERSFTAVEDTKAILIDIEKDQIKNQMFLGEVIDLPQVISVTGAIGNFSTDIQAIGKTKSYKITNGKFCPEVEGEYSVVYSVKDILGRCGIYIYKINVIVSDNPVFIEEPQLLKYYISGFTYEIPIVNAYNFSTGTNAQVTTSISIDGGTSQTLDETRKIKLDATQDNSVVRFTYSTGNQSVYYERPLIKTTAIEGSAERLFMYKYFVASDGVSLSAEDTYSVIQTSVDGNAEFINPLLFADMSIQFNAILNSAKFKNLSFMLTDTYNSEECIKVSLDNSGSAIMSSGDMSINLNKVLGADNTDFVMVFSNNKVSIGDKNIKITKYVNGEDFKGFTSGKVYLNIVFEGVNGLSQLKVKTINNQNLGNNISRDIGKPRVVVNGDIGGFYDKGTIVSTLKGFAADVISPELVFTMTVTSPSGEIVVDVNGLSLVNVSPAKSYNFVLAERGDYKISYTAIDKSLKEASSMYTVRSYVKEYISFETNVKTNIAVGTKITIPSVILNNVDNPSQYKVETYLLDNIGNTILLDSNSLTFGYKGTYVIVFIASKTNGEKIDSSSSLIESITFKVE